MSLKGVIILSILRLVASVDWLYYQDDYSQDAVAKVIIRGANFYSAQFACEILFPGENGLLGKIRNIEMSNAVLSQMTQLRCNSLWIGISQFNGLGSPLNEPKGDWCWSDGTCDAFTNWRLSTNEPNNGGSNEHCAFMMPTTGLWNDAVCTTGWLNCIICEVKRCPTGFGNPLTKNCTQSCAPMKGYYTDEYNYCRYCPAGRFSKSDMPTSCELCEPGKSSEIGKEECLDCVPGRYSNVGTEGICELCPSGFGSNTGSSACALCSPGSYALPGTGCLPCEKGKYSDENGLSTCKTCVNSIDFNSSVLLNTGSFDEDSCQECFPGFFLSLESSKCTECPAGKFRVAGMPPRSCTDCPAGRFNEMTGLSSCEACTSGKWSADLGSSTEQNCKECPKSNGASCPEASPVPYVSQGFFRSLARPDVINRCVPKEACVESGYNSTICKHGYMGDRCSQCLPFEYYRKDRECLRCGKQWPKWIFLGFAGLLLIVMMFLVSTPTDRFGDYIKIPLFGLQALVIIPRLTEDLDPSVVSYIRFFSVVNFDLQIFSFDCDVSFSYWISWTMKLLLPLFVAAFLFLLYVLMRQISALKRFEFPAAQYVYCFIAILQFLYLYLLVILIEPMQCFQQENGVFTMIAFPSLDCYSKEWRTYVFSIGTPFFFIYVVLVPVIFARILWKYRTSIQTELFKKYYGSLTRSYLPEWYWYEGVVTLKKFAIVFLPDLLSSWIGGNVRVLTTLIATMFFLVIDSTFMPYFKPSMNRINILFSSASMFVLMSSYVTSPDNIPPVPDYEKKLIVFLDITFMLFVKVYAVTYFISRRCQLNLIRRRTRTKSVHLSDLKFVK